jgi:tetratricopeptide (TPR) repeat protein
MRKTPVFTALFTIALALSAPVRTAFAGTPAATTPHAEAQKLVSEGVKLWEARSVEAALAKWEEAFKKEADADTLFFIARAKQIQGRFLDAVADYRKYRDLGFNPKLAERDRDEARLREMDCLKNLFQVKVRGPKGAVLKVDGKEVAWSADDTVVLAPGSYQFSLEVSGAPVSRRLAGAGGETVEFGDGVAASNGGTAATGTGNNAGAGAGNGGTKTPVPEEKSSSTGYIVGGSLVGVGALGLVGGVIFASKSNGKFSDAKAAPTAPGAEGLYNDARSAKTLSTVAYIGGAAFIAGGAAAFVFWPKPEKRTAVRVLPGILGASVVGEF